MNANPNILEICMYHDDFGMFNQLGNKTHKHKISAFYFVLGNLPFEYRSRLNDIHLIVLSLASHVGKLVMGQYFPIDREFENSRNIRNYSKLQWCAVHHFKGTLSMVIADNLAADALGGFFCNFSTVQRFCRFRNIRRDQLNPRNLISKFTLRTENAYNNNIATI